MIKKVAALLSMILFHAACAGNGGGSGTSLVPSSTQPEWISTGALSNDGCAPGTKPFEGANDLGYSDDVVCIQDSVLAQYGDAEYREVPGRKKRRFGHLCRVERAKCSDSALCQDVNNSGIGYCRLR